MYFMGKLVAARKKREALSSFTLAHAAAQGDSRYVKKIREALKKAD